MTSNIAFMPVADKVGQKVKHVILRIFRKVKQLINKSGSKSLLGDFVFQCLYKTISRYQMHG